MQDNIRRPLFDGMCELRGIWYAPDLLAENQVHSRILRHWQPNSRLYKVLDGYFLEFPAKRYLHCARIDGLAIAEVNGILSSAPLSSAEYANISLGGFCLVKGAKIHMATLTPGDRVDPSEWLDLDAIPLRTPLEFPRVTNQAGVDNQQPDKTIRDILGAAIPPVSKNQEAFLRETAQAFETGKPGSEDKQAASLLHAAGPLALGAIGLMAGWLSKLISPRHSETGVRKKLGGKPEELSPLAKKLSDFATKMATMTGISKLIGQRQAKFLSDMMDMFERGDVQEALRHAIPLDSMGKKNTHQAFGTPRRRDSLTITGNHGITPSISIFDNMQEQLRKLYRRTFEKLDQEGKIDEAVFVLAELLKSGTEAVTYLETKGRLQQAAELAETLELPPEIRVRLWWLAGDNQRAARLARLTNTFAEAVHLLEKKQSSEGRELRKYWAEHVAARGDLADAAEIIWPLKEERELAWAWLTQAETAGGLLGVRALAKKLALQTSSLKDSEASIMRILDMPDDEGAQLRARLATELITLKEHSVASRRLATEVLRHVLPERMAGLNQLQQHDIKRLRDFADAPVLRADLPNFNLPNDSPSLAFIARTSRLAMNLSERGLMHIHDACHLPDGHYLLAMGESGVSRVDRHGRQIAHYPVPAHHLVLSDNGQRALVLARRDSNIRISRIDLLNRSLSDWLSLPLTFWSGRYDGLSWNVVLDNRLLVIDTSMDKLNVTWQIADLPGRIFAYSESMSAQTLLITAADGIEQWRYSLPSRRLNQRDSWALPDSDIWRLLPVENADEPAKLYLKSTDKNNAVLLTKSSLVSGMEIDIGKSEALPFVHLAEGMIFIKAVNEDTACWDIMNLRNGNKLAQISFPQELHSGVHVQPEHIILFDRAGRLIDINRLNGSVKIFIIN